jgi:hypothetical protein
MAAIIGSCLCQDKPDILYNFVISATRASDISGKASA